MKIFTFCYFVSLILLSTSLFQDTALEESMKRGNEIYADFCVTCHLEKGEGVVNTFPPLAGSDYLKEQREASIRGIKYGQSGELVVNGVTYNGVMTPMGLEDEEVADVMNFISNSWGNSSESIVTLEEIESIQKN